ncbi:hypothetical protein [Phenylobacterium immobile]|uniref:hypothetical protein n=1 Tax=Phenylobacterium immobile TaxID=21 RepID=UPI000B05A099|nr:hypothetical protein [Phenylobacterium immobile]
MRSATLAFMAAAVIGTPVLAESAKAEPVGPKQPIPYSQLKAYSNASPAQRASRDWQAAESRARTGVAADTAATAADPKPTAGSGVNRRTRLSRDRAAASSATGASAGPMNSFPPGETEPPV